MFLAFIVCFISALYVWWYKRPLGFPPGPRGLPVLGVIPFFSQKPALKFQDWSRHYGPIFSARVGRREWVILNSYDIIKEAMVHQGRKFAARPPNYILDVYFEAKNKGGIGFSSGKVWETLRKLGDTAFRSMGVGKQRFECFTQTELSILIKDVIPKKSEAYDCRGDLAKSFANVVCHFIFGKRFDYSDELFKWATDSVMADPKKAKLFNVGILLPFSRFLPPVAHALLDYKTQRQRGFECFKVEIEKHRSSLDSSDVRDFIDVFLLEQKQERDQNGGNIYFSDDQLLSSIANLFGASIDTSAATMTWCFLSLLHFPDFQERIQAEIDTVIGEKIPSFSDRNDMHFTQAFIQEIGRFSTTFPLGLPRCTVENVKIGGYFIPKDTQVMVNLWACHNDPDLFENPRQFQPDRFLDSEGNFIKCLQVIPFNIGTRHCLGEPLARMVTFMCLVSILQKYSVRSDETSADTLPRMDDGLSGVVYFPKPFKTLFVPRH